ncbi:MAG: 4-amino-4-deoxychorismate lyase [Solirubrobacterales bacterium]|jgi:branched-chain amino acid aminotransferase|nr:4-amino-4-deoxychorismate lyase [Solirubrobacterales bacterium]
MDLAILDGTVQPASAAVIPITDEGLLRGDGVFEVIRLYAGVPYALEEHLERIAASAANLRLPIDTDALRADVAALLAQAGPLDATLRVLVTRGGRRIGILEALKPLPPTLTLATVAFAPTRVLDGIKSLSYAANMLTRRLAQEQGADDALLLTPHGRVLEGPTASFFAVLEGELVTPPLSDHILDSITRRKVMAVSDAQERVLARGDLPRLEEAFLASTLCEVHPVTAIDGALLPGAPGPRTSAVAAAVRALIARELGA